MVFLSSHFAVLACLCAALPLTFPPRAEAAHLHGSYSMQKHASSPYSQQRTRTHDGRPTATHTHDGKNKGYQAPDHRDSQPPPLLRRYHVHDHDEVHNQHGQRPHDDAHHKVPRSAFARNRYRRAPAYLSRRSSVYVPGEHGNTYLVSRTPRNREDGHTGIDKQPPHSYNRRQVDQSNLVLGRIDIMGAAQSPGSTQRLASLTVDSTPIDWTSGQSSAKAFPLNASTANQTQFIMLPADETSNVTGGSNKHITLATEVFDASNAEMVMYCATYDSDPGATSALLMTPCTSAGTTHSAAPANDAADPCADDGNDASSTSHESQIFSYDPSSGQIEPISVTDSSSGTDNSVDDPTPCAGARVRRDNGNSTTSSSARPSSTSTSTAPTPSASQQARNVTLVFVAGALELAASSVSSPGANTATASIGQASVLTKTITTTVVVGVTASAPPAGTITPAQAAVSVSTSSVPSTTISAPSGFTTVTATRSSLSLSSSVSGTATSRAPANADESFEVEIIGVAPTTTATTVTTTATIKATSSSSSSTVSTSLDAMAVASSIANAMASPQVAIFASASISPAVM